MCVWTASVPTVDVHAAHRRIRRRRLARHERGPRPLSALHGVVPEVVEAAHADATVHCPQSQKKKMHIVRESIFNTLNPERQLFAAKNIQHHTLYNPTSTNLRSQKTRGTRTTTDSGIHCPMESLWSPSVVGNHEAQIELQRPRGSTSNPLPTAQANVSLHRRPRHEGGDYVRGGDGHNGDARRPLQSLHASLNPPHPAGHQRRCRHARRRQASRRRHGRYSGRHDAGPDEPSGRLARERLSPVLRCKRGGGAGGREHPTK